MKDNTKSKNYGPMDRQLMEDSESSKRIKTDLPGTRFSETAQVVDADQNVTPHAGVASSGEKTDLVAKALESVKSKVKVKPDANVQLLQDTQVGGVPIGSGQAVLFSAAGASKGPTTVEDSSRIPYTNGGYRPDSRFGKKTSDNDFLINNAISEQIVPEFEGTQDLRQNPDALQGYNGQKQFKTARGKKNAGTMPQSSLFDRSVDFMKIDSTVHTTGQVLDNIDAASDYPTVTAASDSKVEADDHGYVAIDNPMHKSNYLLKSFSFNIDAAGRVNSPKFNEDKLPAHCPENQTMQANTNWQVDRNNVAKSVVRLQKELGRETTDKWSPLGYVIEQPYQTNMLAHDIEATTGAMMLAAYRAANSSLAYQSGNKLAKDGAKPQTPVVEMFLEGIGQLSKSIDLSELSLTSSADFEKTVFGPDLLQHGSAAAIIKMFDTANKYTTKANFFNLPRSLKYFIQNMDNNINPLHCKKNFLMALDTAHVYSTFDGEYNPMLPIVATDKISLVNPLSLNYFLKDWSRSNVTADNASGCATIYSYKYNDLRCNYQWELRHPIVDGLMAWLVKHEAALVKAYGTNVTVTIPCFMSMMAPSMFQMLLCAASQEILWSRNIYFRDFLFAGEQSEYIWPDLDSLEHLNPKFSSNLTITDYKTPLKLGKMKPASFFHIYWGDSFQTAAATDPAVGTKLLNIYMPYYYNETSFGDSYNKYNGFYDEKQRQFTMSYPEVRIGVRHDYIDMVKSVSERDFRLSLDRSIGIPCFMTPTDNSTNGGVVEYTDQVTSDAKTSKIKIRAVRYDLNSDGRLLVSYNNEANSRIVPNKAAVMCLPRELGFLYPHFRVSPIISSIAIDDKNKTLVFATVGSYAVKEVLDGSMGYSLISYRAIGGDSSGKVNQNVISRTAALQQDFITFFADRSNEVVLLNDAYLDAIGICPTFSSMLDPTNNDNFSINTERATVDPFYVINSSNHASEMKGSKIVTFSRLLWPLINRVFLPVNPFENCFVAKGTKEDYASSGVFIDPMESSFMFGLAGFFASDFEQDVLDRADKMDMLNLDYTEDEFIKSSPVFRAD